MSEIENDIRLRSWRNEGLIFFNATASGITGFKATIARRLNGWDAFVKFGEKSSLGLSRYPNSLLTSPLFSVGNLSRHKSMLWEEGDPFF